MQCSPVADKILALQRQPKNVRNICIMAHVDHGKTTLADALVAINGIISQKLAGKLRYLDSRKDEQERGITMKSSAVALRYTRGNEDYLINLIDSPGHVDFTGEVSSAVQLCDGALIVVDVVEGVCAQTKLAIRQAWVHGIKMVVILNKMDRLITELKLTPLDAYIHLQQILEQVNAVVGELFNSEVLGKKTDDEYSNTETSYQENTSDQVYDWSSGLDDTDDSNLYFLPDRGNVIFTSGIDGWGFGIHNFAKLYATKLGVREDVLLKTLWGDFYLNAKTKRILKGAQTKAKKPLFVQFILENIWAVYNAVLERKDKEMTEKIVRSLNVKISAREARYVDPKGQLQSIFHQWLPLATSVLDMVCEKLPSPLEITETRAEKLMCTKHQQFESLPSETRNLKTDFCQCSSSSDIPVIAYVSKMFAVEKTSLPRERPRPLSEEEIALRRERARQRHLEMQAQKETVSAELEVETKTELSVTEDKEEDKIPYVFVAFARVFSGTVRKGQQLYILGPKHDPENALRKSKEGVIIDPTLTVDQLKSDQHITVATIKELYIFMGRELEAAQEIPAGNIFGIGELDAHIIKTATISSTLACPPFCDLSVHSVPILRVAIEPVHSGDMPKLVKGLKLLNQADASVKVFIQETGEHVIVTAGEVHLQRCLDDLRERFAKIEINVSTPIVPFRETIVLPPKLDMVNEAIVEDKSTGKSYMKKDIEDSRISFGVVELKTPNKLSTIKIKAVPLPDEVIKLLDEYCDKIKTFDKYIISSRRNLANNILDSDSNPMSEKIIHSMNELKLKLEEIFTSLGGEWKNCINQIWAFGPRRCGPNILLARILHYQPPVYWNGMTHQNSGGPPQAEFDNSFVNGFQLATNSGPLCEEPMRGVCFIVEDWTVECNTTENLLSPNDIDDAMSCSSYDSLSLKGDFRNFSEGVTPYGPFSGQIISTVREACRKAFQSQPQRIMTAMYSCNIQVTAEVLGKMYAVLGKRNGRILHGDLQEGSSMFYVTAVLPVIESFDFANEIRRQTSGQALPQLTFSHWEVVDTDPFWVPTTEEEYLLYGEKADSEIRARKYMNMVRKRKGLPVDEKIVEHAEKQRTLMRKK